MNNKSASPKQLAKPYLYNGQPVTVEEYKKIFPKFQSPKSNQLIESPEPDAG